MRHKLFSVYDSAAEAYLPPFILPNVQMAQRIFGDCINSPEHQFSKHPEDYTLFELGIFDDETGKHELQRTPKSLGLGLEYVRQDDSYTTEGDPNAETIRTLAPPVSNGSSVQPGTAGDDPPE